MPELTEEDVVQHDLDLRFCNAGNAVPATLSMSRADRRKCLERFIKEFSGPEAVDYYLGGK